MSNNNLIMVGLTMEQWDFITTQLDLCHCDIQDEISLAKEQKQEKSIIREKKEIANYLEEILDDIADQLSGITEEMVEG